jgi:thiosulfate reductase/polysulfide reductase chain A
MDTLKAPNVASVGTPGKRTVYSLCGMCAVRCPIEVTVQDGKIVWIQGNHHDKAIGTSLCAKGSAGLAFEFDDERPQTPLIRTGSRGVANGDVHPGMRPSIILQKSCRRPGKHTEAVE